MKLINFNLWIGGILWDELINFLKQENADILALQEVYKTDEKGLEPRFNSFNELAQILGYQYTHFAPTFIEDRGDYVEQGNAIFSKYPLHEENVQFFVGEFSKRKDGRENFPFSPRNLQHVSIDLVGNTLHLINLQGVWAEHGEDNEQRLKMAEIILKEATTVKENEPLIICGDFNVKPNTNTIRMIEEKYTNVFKDMLETSFNLKRKDLENYPGYATAVVDMIFINGLVNLEQKHVPEVDISDHLPQVIQFTL